MRRIITSFELERLSKGWIAKIYSRNDKGEVDYSRVAYRSKKQILKSLDKYL